MPNIAEPADLRVDVHRREGRKGTGGGGGRRARVDFFRRYVDLDLSRAVAFESFGVLDLDVAVCADAVCADTAAMTAVVTKSVRSLMAGTYPEKTDELSVKVAGASRAAPRPFVVAYGVIMFRRPARRKSLEASPADQAIGSGTRPVRIVIGEPARMRGHLPDSGS
jgi:hypothetical protein